MKATQRNCTQSDSSVQASITKGFSTERDLVVAFEGAFITGSSATWTWLSEFDSPSGIADLVAVKRRAACDAASLAALPQRWAYVLKCLPYRQGFSLPWFAETYGTSPSYARGILQRYVHNGFCMQNSCDRTWIKIKEPQPVAEKIVAVEAKLRDCRRALYQASRYLDYAGESWVVLDHGALRAALSRIDDFIRIGVGLIGLSRHGDMEIVTRPTERAPRMLSRFWHANAEIARRIEPLGL